jgi:MerR family transcriptional regulator, light-induced transcriptional regulator
MQGINTEIARIIHHKMELLSEATVSRQYELQPEVWEPYGDKGRELSLRDSNHHFRYLIEALTESDPTIFANYIAWLKQLFEGLKFPPEALTKMLECTKEVLREQLSQEMSSITDEYMDAAASRIEHESLSQSSFITKDLPLHDLAARYLDALLRGERHLASSMILEEVEKGASIRDIYIYVFQRSQYEIGRLWHLNRASVAQEHYCSAATQLIMSQLYPYIFSSEKTGRRLVAACVGGELHEIGIRMVADFFEMEGWDTYYMGANTPTSTIIEALESHQPDVLAISASMPFHRKALKELITTVRDYDRDGKVKILVGGYALRSSPDLWIKLGADGFAEDAQQAVSLASQIVTRASL